MSIQHALLTSLLEKPSAGYELAHRFDRSIGYFWQATHQQIYRELGRMVEAGWVATEEGDDGGRRRKKTYHVLPAGRKELKRWVGQATPVSESRRTLLVKLRAEAIVGPTALDQDLARLIEEHRAQLEAYRQIERRDFAMPSPPVAQRLQHAVLRSGILAEEAWLEWAAEVLEVLHLRTGKRK